MKTSKGRNNRGSVQATHNIQQQQSRFPPKGEEGQSMLEMTIGLIFLLIIVLILFEMAMLFYSYIAVLNASREGAVYASAYPEMTAAQSQQYQSVAAAEAQAAGLNTDPTFFIVDPPETPDGTDPLNPIIVRVHYQLINPTQGVFLPVLGRMGLFQTVWMTGETEMPIR
jgi:hypothetical protein